MKTVHTKNSAYHLVEDDRGLRVRRVTGERFNRWTEVIGDGWRYLASRPEPVVGVSMRLEYEDNEVGTIYTSAVLEILEAA